jgi:hypothetical protein
MTVADITPLVIGLGGLIVAGLSLILNYLARVTHFRQAIYGKQMDGYTEVVQALNEWYQFANGFITMHQFRLDGDDVRIELRKQSAELNDKASKAKTKWMLLMPSEFNEAVDAFRSVFNAVSALSQFTKGYPPELVNSTDPMMDLANAYLRVVNVSRKYLGTDALTTGVSNMISGKEKANRSA